MMFCLGLYSQRPMLKTTEKNSLGQHLETLYSEGDLDSLFVICNKTLQGQTSSLNQGFAYYFKALVEEDKRRWQVAFDFFDMATEAFKKSEYHGALPVIYLAQAEILFKLYQFSAADSLYDSAIQISLKPQANDILAFAYIGKAQVLLEQHEFQSANEELKSALGYAEKTTDLTLSVNIANQLSTNFQSQGELDSAIVYFDKSLKH